MSIAAGEILAQLDFQNNVPMGFPHFGVFFPIDVRLSAFRSSSRWALVIETFVFNEGPEQHACICNMVYCFGNSLPASPGVQTPHIYVTDDGPSGPLFDPDDILGHRVSPRATDMRLRQAVVAVPTDVDTYREAGVILRKPPSWEAENIEWTHPPGIHGCELMRLVTPAHRNLCLATEQEIIDRIGADMWLILRLDEWHHADRDHGKRPSESPSYQLVAEVLASSDPSRYRPTLAPNTHWKNWPEAGFM